MNRRMFLQLSGTGAAMAVLTPAILLTTGCSLKGDAQTVIDTLTAIVNADPNAAWVPDLKIAIQDAQMAMQNWNGTSANCKLQSAITIAAGIIDSLPLGTNIDLIVAIALAGIDGLLNDLAPCTTDQLAPLNHRLSRTYTRSVHRGTATYSYYLGQFKGSQQWRFSGDYKRAFNNGCKESGLPQVEIK